MFPHLFDVIGQDQYNDEDERQHGAEVETDPGHGLSIDEVHGVAGDVELGGPERLEAETAVERQFSVAVQE